MNHFVFKVDVIAYIYVLLSSTYALVATVRKTVPSFLWLFTEKLIEHTYKCV